MVESRKVYVMLKGIKKKSNTTTESTAICVCYFWAVAFLFFLQFFCFGFVAIRSRLFLTSRNAA